MPLLLPQEFVGIHPLAGIDEAGRGPWAGPVVAAAVIFTAPYVPGGVDDSKKLSKARREALFDAIYAAADVGVGQASVEEIDTLNILNATLLAMQRAAGALRQTPALALIDGNRAPALSCPARAVVGGDACVPAIAAASIIAKVTRDRLMAELAREFPAYGFDRHAGYGTPQHQAALERYGPCPHHRKSFAPVRALLHRACA